MDTKKCERCCQEENGKLGEVFMIEKAKIDTSREGNDGYYQQVTIYQCPLCKNIEIE